MIVLPMAFPLIFRLEKMKNRKRNSWRARIERVVTITKECNTQRAPTHSLLQFARVRRR